MILMKKKLKYFNLDICVQIIEIPMISRVLPIFDRLLPMLTHTSRFHLATQDFKADRIHQREVLKLESCNSLRDVMSYISLNGNKFSDNQSKMGIRTMMRLRYTAQPWENMSGFGKNIQSYDVATCDIETLGYLSGLASLFSQNYAINIKFYNRVLERIKHVIQQPEGINDQTLLNFLDCAYELDRRDVIDSLHEVIITRIPTLRYKDYSRFLEVINRRKMPSKKEKQTLNAFLKKFENEIEKVELRTVIGCYRFLKPINHRVWDCEPVVKKIEETLSNKIDEFDEKQIVLLLNFKGALNIFQKQIFKRLIDSLQNGNSLVGNDVFFKLLRKVELNDATKVAGDNEAKIMDLLEQNLENSREVINIIQKNILTRQSLVKLAAKISESEHRNKYETNHFYVYEMVSKGIFKSDNNYKQYIDSIKTEPRKVNIGLKFVSQALIVEKLQSKNYQNQELKQLHEEFKKLVVELGKSPKVFSSTYFSNAGRLFETFSRRYGNYLLQNFVKQYSEPNKKINNSQLNFLLISNNRDIFRILSKNKSVVTMQQVGIILRKACANPSQFVGKHQFLSNLLTNLMTPEARASDVRTVLNYLCNWEVHANLEVQEAAPYLRLAQAYVKVFGQNSYLLRNLFTYFVSSPSAFIKMNLQLPKLLEQIQERILNQQKQQPLGRNTYLFSELIRFNILSYKMAQKILDEIQQGENNKVSPFIIKYAQVLTRKNKPNMEEQITADNLISIVKCRDLKDEDIDNHLARINEAVIRLKNNDIESILVNFGMSKTQKTIGLLDSIVQKYIESIKQRPRYKLFSILQNFQKNSYNSTTYRDLIKVLCEHYTKNIEQISLALHTLILSECVNKNVECTEYAKRLTYFLETKYLNGQVRINDAHGLIENLMVLDFELAFKMFSNFKNYFFDGEKKKAIDVFALANLKDEKARKLLLKFFKNLKNIEISEGIYEYLSSSIPELKELGLKIKTEPARENWLTESLTSLLKDKEIPFTIQTKHGEKAIIVGSKYIFTSSLLYNDMSRQKLQDYYGSMFGMEAEERSKRIIVLFLSRRNDKKSFASILSNGIQELKDHKSAIVQAFVDHENKQKEIKREKKAKDSENPEAGQEKRQNSERKNKKQHKKPQPEEQKEEGTQKQPEPEKQSKKTAEKSQWQS